MKRLFMLPVLALALFSLSCEKDNDPSSTRQQISLLANGVLFSVTTGDAGVEEADAHIRDGNKFQLDATNATQDFSINNQTVPGTGTYPMIGAGNVLNFVQWEDGSALFSSLGTTKSRFTFTITRVAGNASDYVRPVEGTFSGVLYNVTQTDSVIITNGQISIVD